jgi:hydrogenase nickel incorporation protein HypB
MGKHKIDIQTNIFQANEQLAHENFSLLQKHNIFSVNIMASPGAGKTSIIEHTVKKLSPEFNFLVIDGDIATNFDADRAAKAGAKAIQINTGGECHLDASMVNLALKEISYENIDILIIENVGNLICPSNFKLGVHKNILVASITEGDDKPYKYPGAYRGVDAIIINKIDLLPYVPFRMEFFLRGIEVLNPGVDSFQVSCITGEGIGNWLKWLSELTLRIKKTSV